MSSLALRVRRRISSGGDPEAGGTSEISGAKEGTGGELTCSGWFVAERQELIGFERERGVGAPLVVGELHLKDAGSQDLHYGSYLSSVQAALGQVPGDGYHVEDVYRVLHLSPRVPNSLRTSGICAPTDDPPAADRRRSHVGLHLEV